MTEERLHGVPLYQILPNVKLVVCSDLRVFLHLPLSCSPFSMIHQDSADGHISDSDLLQPKVRSKISTEQKQVEWKPEKTRCNLSKSRPGVTQEAPKCPSFALWHHVRKAQQGSSPETRSLGFLCGSAGTFYPAPTQPQSPRRKAGVQ